MTSLLKVEAGRLVRGLLPWSKQKMGGWTRVTAKEVMEVADRHPVKAELLADGM